MTPYLPTCSTFFSKCCYYRSIAIVLLVFLSTNGVHFGLGIEDNKLIEDIVLEVSSFENA